LIIVDSCTDGTNWWLFIEFLRGKIGFVVFEDFFEKIREIKLAVPLVLRLTKILRYDLVLSLKD
jgi:hypothetical protein